MSLNSTDPFSLQNALRFAAARAETGTGVWGESSWNDRDKRSESILLLNAQDPDAQDFRKALVDLEPNLVLIGSMSLCLPGAIQLASITREVRGDRTFIVLGGKHVNETLYEKNGELRHHPGSPLLQMKEGRIPRLFDLLISGDGEEVIFRLGELLALYIDSRQPLGRVYQKLDKLRQARGEWLAAWLANGKTQWVKGIGHKIDYDQLESPSKLFGIRSNFPVFSSELTAHAYSDIGKGCIYDCFFCSERSSINSLTLPLDNAPIRLAKHLKTIKEVAQERYGKNIASAFVEDSILLGGLPANLQKFQEITQKEGIDIHYGGQFTVDLLLDRKRQQLITELAQGGLRYIFWGLETGNEGIAGSMSKNVGRSPWTRRNEEAIKFVSGLGLKCGISLVFGLGESSGERFSLLKQIEQWQETYAAPNVIGFNWAVQHPLRGYDADAGYDYLTRGTPADSPYLDHYFELFGEASVNYPLPGIDIASLSELEDLCAIGRSLATSKQ